MQEGKTEGIVLRSLDYRDGQRIITVFTRHGLISLIVKGITKNNSQLLTLTSPLCEGEFAFKQNHSQLLLFVDGSVIDFHLCLRKRLASLETAALLTQTILTSQLEGKPAFNVYSLFRLYLKQISSFDTPRVLLASFQLKLLSLEGMLSLSSTCNRCQSRQALFLNKGESLCMAHPREGEGFCFSSTEWSFLLQLQQAQQFSSLRTLLLPSHLSQKIDVYFKYRLAE